jgi:hypothetical protein
VLIVVGICLSHTLAWIMSRRHGSQLTKYSNSRRLHERSELSEMDKSTRQLIKSVSINGGIFLIRFLGRF